MKICILSNLYSPNIVGGAERMAQMLAESLVSEGHNVFVISMRCGDEPSIDILNGVKVYYIKLKNIYKPYAKRRNVFMRIGWHSIDAFNIMMANSITSIISNEKPDLVHTHNLTGFSTACWIVLKKLGLPIVHTLHDYYLLCHHSTMFKNRLNCVGQCWDCRRLSYPKRISSNSVDIIIGVSKYILDTHLRAGYFKNNCRYMVINNGLPAHEDANSQHHGAKLGIIYGYIGRLAPEKGIDEALNAFVCSKNPNTFYVAGDGDEKFKSYLTSKYQISNVVFLGKVNADDFYGLIDVLVIPSIWNEPLGTVIIEAFRAGIPVYGHDTGGTAEMIKHGVNGLLFSDFNDLEDIFSNEDENLPNYVMMAKESFKDFTIEKCVSRYINAYSEAIAKRS